VRLPTAHVRLRSASAPHAARRVSWLELFFDLIFVAAVAQVAEPLHHHYSAGELQRLTPLFALIWWAWTGHAWFATRFETADTMQRVLTLVQMFVVAVMAANAKDALDSRSSAGFAASYAAGRFLLVAQYARARHLPGARALARHYMLGQGTAAAVWLASALVQAPERYWLWAAAFAIDLGTPWIVVRHTVDVPHNEHHLPERFGLFTLVLLGEGVVSVMTGMESQEDWPVAAAVSAFMSMALLFMLWWWYFDGAAVASEQRVRTEREAFRFHVWTYAHLPFCLAIVVTGVGLNELVGAASHATLEPAQVVLLTSAMAGAMLMLTLIGAMSASRMDRVTSWLHAVLAAGVAILGMAGAVATPVAVVLLLCGACLAQLWLSLGWARRARPGLVFVLGDGWRPLARTASGVAPGPTSAITGEHFS
jgi:low temperature requirement protein LtrA